MKVKLKDRNESLPNLESAICILGFLTLKSLKKKKLSFYIGNKKKNNKRLNFNIKKGRDK